MPGGSRIVIDSTGPVRIDKAFVLDAADGQPARLVLDLAAVDRETFLRADRGRQPRAATGAASRISREPPPSAERSAAR